MLKVRYYIHTGVRINIINNIPEFNLLQLNFLWNLHIFAKYLPSLFLGLMLAFVLVNIFNTKHIILSIILITS